MSFSGVFDTAASTSLTVESVDDRGDWVDRRHELARPAYVTRGLPGGTPGHAELREKFTTTDAAL